MDRSKSSLRSRMLAKLRHALPSRRSSSPSRVEATKPVQPPTPQPPPPSPQPALVAPPTPIPSPALPPPPVLLTPPPFVPPTTWTGRMMTTDPCRCLRDPLVANMDPLVAAAFHNQSCSPLLKLPEEMLVDIMTRLDLLSIECLRRVCRTFLRLYCSPEFSHTHWSELPSELFYEYYHWYPTRPPKQHIQKPLRLVLEKDIGDYCRDCRARRMDPNWKKNWAALATEYLHCSGCQFHHPAALFSLRQRLAPATDRICIGREGWFPVCDSMVLQWSDIESTAVALSELETKQALIELGACSDASHEPRHHAGDPALTAHQAIHPFARIGGCGNKDIWLEIVWRGHLKLPHVGYDEHGSSELATPAQLRSLLEGFRRGTAAEYLSPELPPGRLTEMNCFDPNRCSCLRYAGREHVPGGWHLTQRSGDEFACRKRPEYYGLKALRASRAQDDANLERRKWRKSHYVKVSIGAKNEGDVYVDIKPCPARSPCLQLRYTRGICIIRQH